MSIRQTRLSRDGFYHYGAVLSQAAMQRSGVASSRIRFVREMCLRDPRMEGKVSVEFYMHVGQSEFVPNLLLMVKPITGHVPRGDSHSAAYRGYRHERRPGPGQLSP